LINSLENTIILIIKPFDTSHSIYCGNIDYDLMKVHILTYIFICIYSTYGGQRYLSNP